jgi:hypothetical protein
MSGYSNLHTEKRAWETERRRVAKAMSNIDRIHGRSNRHRAEMEELTTELRAQLEQVIADQADAKKHNNYAEVMKLHQEAEQLAGQITDAESEAESAQKDADKSKEDYADWLSHMPAPWRLVPILCPACLSDHVEPAPNDAVMQGVCGECDADVNLPPGTIRHEGRSYVKRQAAS